MLLDQLGALPAGPFAVELPHGGIAARQYALIATTDDSAHPDPLTYAVCVG